MLRKTVVAAFVMIAGLCMAQPAPWNPKLPFDHAVISYKVGGTEKGTQTLYVKDGGLTTAKHRKTSVKMFGIKQESNTIEVVTPEFIISANLVDKTGSKNVNPVKYMIEEYNKLSEADKKKVLANAEKTGMNMMQGMQGKFTARAAKIHGYDCDKVEVMGMTNFMISGTGIQLKTDGNIMGIKTSVEADSIDTKVALPANAFDIPAGIRFENSADADAMAKTMAQTTIKSLVSGNVTPAATSTRNGKGAQSNSQIPQLPEGMPEGLGDLQKIMEQMNQE